MSSSEGWQSGPELVRPLLAVLHDPARLVGEAGEGAAGLAQALGDLAKHRV